MRTRRVLGGALAAVAGLLAVGIAGRVLARRRTARRVSELRRRAATGRGQVFTTADLDGLPDPVQEYLASALREGQPYVDSVRIEQAGRLRAGDASSPWRPFTATQHVTVDPPGFLWDASIDLAPLVSLRVRDCFRDGSGSADVSLFGVLPVDGAAPSPELNEAELMRYLAEAVWYPTALFPREGVEWRAIDDETARATVEQGDATASLTFTFDGDEVRRVHADARYRRVADGYEPTPWSGRWRNYETRNGVRVPTAGEAVWHLPDGDVTAWQGHVTEIRFDER